MECECELVRVDDDDMLYKSKSSRSGRYESIVFSRLALSHSPSALSHASDPALRLHSRPIKIPAFENFTRPRARVQVDAGRTTH